MSTIKTEEDIKQSKDEFKNFLNGQLEQINYWLSFAEAKNGALLAINVAIMAVLVSIFDMAPVICTLTIICFILSCGVCLKSFFPNTNNRPSKRKNDDGNKNPNLMFYGDIAKITSCCEYIELSSKRYFPEIKCAKDDKLIYDLASEILINSRITLQKYVDFRFALKIDFIALLMTIMFFVAA